MQRLSAFLPRGLVTVDGHQMSIIALKYSLSSPGESFYSFAIPATTVNVIIQSEKDTSADSGLVNSSFSFCHIANRKFTYAC